MLTFPGSDMSLRESWADLSEVIHPFALVSELIGSAVPRRAHKESESLWERAV